jgi:hypothetical protein
MHGMEQVLITFFEQVAQRDRIQLKKLKQEQAFTVEQGRWCFSLSSLYAFLQRQNDGFGDIDYKQFRQLLYSSPVNQAVKVHGAEIVITDNQSNVDKSSYALVWYTTEQE